MKHIRHPRVEIDDDGNIWATPKSARNNKRLRDVLRPHSCIHFDESRYNQDRAIAKSVLARVGTGLEDVTLQLVKRTSLRRLPDSGRTGNYGDVGAYYSLIRSMRCGKIDPTDLQATTSSASPS
jgi:hypothetical protein